MENIKKRQQAAARTEEVVPVASQSVEATPAAAGSTEGASNAVEQNPELGTIAVLTEPKVAGESVVTVVAGQESLQPITGKDDVAATMGTEIGTAIDADATVTPEITSEATETPEFSSRVPIWMQAAADREAKLERLRSTAIEIDEPPARPTSSLASSAPDRTAAPPAAVPHSVAETESATVDVDPLPELVLDEGFLWSAEVLAAQGRQAEDVSIEEITWLKRLRQGLDRTRRSLVNQLKAIVGQGPLNPDAVESIEELLLQADVGVEATDYIVQALQRKLRDEVLPPEQAIGYLKQLLRDMLDAPLQGNSRHLAPEKGALNIWLITGVNGVGKTTTIGKLAHIATKSGYSCLIAAADTFRAAAVEQVKIWGQRSNVEVIANPGQNTDPAAVVYDAIAAAQSRGTELLLVDTAGRLQNKKNLMDELSKIRRIIDKRAANANIQSFLVLDASLGQNGVRQAEVFLEAAQLNGVILTKLDGTAKGGVALAVVQQLGLPIRFIGAGEGIEDLRPFSSYEFVEALLSG
ncbi:MAG: signal recognition particle-docking protein FtsY [Cyanobacteria bacterium]|nr:signal recognition particle-docking protein FtsY [Cyanobacteriota bacterium]